MIRLQQLVQHWRWHFAPVPLPLVVNPFQAAGGVLCGSGIPDETTSGQPPQVPARGFWIKNTATSALDDSPTVYLTLYSPDLLNSPYGGAKSAPELSLRCEENTTAVIFGFGENFMASIQGYGRIDYRIDDRKASHINTQESTSNKHLGLWSGNKAIPFIKQLFGGSKLVVRAVPFNADPIEVTFRIDNTEAAVTELREACGW